MKQVLISEELLRQAIETLDLAQALLEKSNHHMTVLSAYTALRAALEQPAPREHMTDDSQCWCNPETVYTDPDTGASVIIHKEPQ